MTKAEAVQSETSAPEATRDELVARARALVPVLRERAPYCEELRRIPDETVAALKAAGVTRIATPKRFGGMGHDLEVIADVAGETARGCGSTGWMTSFWATHQYQVGWWSEEAQAEYWADGPDTLSSTVSALVSYESEPEPDGLRLSGRWRFSSGIDHAEWIILHTPNETCLVPRSDFRTEDDWFVSGLRGTGSKTVVIDDAFVPAHRMITHDDLGNGHYPGRALYDSPWYKLPNPAVLVLPNFILAPILGMVQGIADGFEERVRTRHDPQTQQPAFELHANQARFAEGTAELHAARLVHRRNLEDLRRWGGSGGHLTLEERTYSRRNVTYATKLCTAAANRLIDGVDSSALYESNSIHRLGRDVRAGALQFALAWDEAAAQFSRVRWGLEPQTLLF
jgi:alkylation response protein AidB-like acyl-CoA dehydrogenase